MAETPTRHEGDPFPNLLKNSLFQWLHVGLAQGGCS